MIEEAKSPKSNVRIIEALNSLDEAFKSLVNVITEIDTGEEPGKSPTSISSIDASRSISELIKSIPSELTEYAEKIESQIDRLRSLVL